jgi:hypothetical protein
MLVTDSNLLSNGSNDQEVPPQGDFPEFFHDQNEVLETECNNLMKFNKTASNPIKLFIGGVPPNMKKGELNDMFHESVSQVPAWPSDVKTGNISCHHGFGFIDVSNIEEFK